MFLCTKKWSSAKLSLNRDLSLSKMLLNRECTVLQFVKKRIITALSASVIDLEIKGNIALRWITS